MDNMKTPCRHCEDRSATCHADCEKYAEYAAWRDEVRREKATALHGNPSKEWIDRCVKNKQRWFKRACKG